MEKRDIHQEVRYGKEAINDLRTVIIYSHSLDPDAIPDDNKTFWYRYDIIYQYFLD